MAKQKHKPIHPGVVLKRDFMAPLGVSAYRLSKETGIGAQHYGRIIKGTRGINAGVALRLARYFGTTADLWMNLQTKYELDVAENLLGREIQERVKPHKAA